MNKAAVSLRQKPPLSILADLGIKTSHQRVAILRYLLDHDTHPSVDGIYSALAPVTSGLSRTTIYNTLKLFVSKGLVEELTIDGTESRYDLRDPSHSHFQCLDCGRIYDVDIPAMATIDRSLPAGFLVEEQHLYLKGLCPACAPPKKRTKLD